MIFGTNLTHSNISTKFREKFAIDFARKILVVTTPLQRGWSGTHDSSCNNQELICCCGANSKRDRLGQIVERASRQQSKMTRPLLGSGKMLKGQWTGPYAGSSAGDMIIELDEIGPNLVGTAVAHPGDIRLPSALVPITISAGIISVNQKVSIFPIDVNTGHPVEWAQIAPNFPTGTTMSTTADVKFRLSSSGIMYVSWETDTGRTGLATLKQGPAASTRTPEPINTWEDFKAFAAQQPPYQYVYRGHSDNQWPLRTHFHRTGRANLRRFVNEDIPNLHREIAGLTTHYFHMSDSTEYGAFNALAQHHGYPTPLLDWTFSPYVAAFFAFRAVKKLDRVSGQKIRILIFDSKEWRKDFLQITQYLSRPHFSLFAPLGINNTRLIPQQALSSVCNLDDIEGYLAAREIDKQKAYLKVIDLPKAERQKAMTDLAMMGITAGSLFPGLDGACEQLRERYFDY
jgi:FRG domain-containing protein